MNKLDIVVKCIILLFRENELSMSMAERSNDLVKTILNTLKDVRGKTLTGGDTSLIDDARALVSNMINNQDSFDQHTIMQTVELIFKDKPGVIKTIEKAITSEMTENQLKKSTVILRNSLNNYYTEHEITNLVNKASYQLTMGKLENESVKDFVTKLVNDLEALNVTSEIKDPGVVDELDISDLANMATVINKAKDNSMGTGKLKTRWNGMNIVTQGGFRRGETVIINALQHKYKSGFTQSIFMQLPMANIPFLDNPEKKPLIVYISAEDDTDVFTGFMYKYLYYNEFKAMPDMSSITSAEISSYISAKLTKNGYHVKILKINPSEWSIKHLFNKVIKWESEGFELHGLLFDYLAKLPTIGCTNTGPGGTEVRDMFNRCRNFFNGNRRALFITPHQLSTEAKQLIRNGVSDVNFVKEIAGKGYTELSKQIDQVVDLELYIHIAHVNRKPFLTIQRGKHRIDSILDDDKHYFMLPFPYKAPILEDINEDGSVMSTATGGTKTEDDDFDF